jgi:hypothetical protein
MTKPIGFLKDATLLRDEDNNPLRLQGNCLAHEERRDLVHRYMYSSLILRQIDENTFETRNSIYKVQSWVEPLPPITPEEIQLLQKYFAALIV